MATGAYRRWLRPDDPKHAHLSTSTAVEHANLLLVKVPFVRDLSQYWNRLWHEPFSGITTDGTVIPNLYHPADDGIDIHAIVKAGNRLLAQLAPDERKKLLYDLDAPERRCWSNPEIYLHRIGLRLDETSENVQTAFLDLLRTTLSPEGYEKATRTMAINHFLGELHDAHEILNRWSYNFVVFGQPSTTEPWGFLVYGHHLDLSVALHGCQITLTPAFTGAEPNEIDAGPLSGTRILVDEEVLGLRFMQSLPPHMQRKAQIYAEMDDPSFSRDFQASFPDCRWNPADQRQLCGAFQDNRVVPLEGVCLGELDDSGGALSVLLLEVVEQFVLYLPGKARENRLKQVREHLVDTYFSWIGEFGDDDPFYYRIQSPVIICEFDHHSGVFLLNEAPAKFHIHTIVRSPNGGDYGHALRQSSS